MFDVFLFVEVVNISVELLYGINVFYLWDFGDGKNVIIIILWVMYCYEVIGIVVVNFIVINRVSLVSIWCLIVV